MSADRVAKIQPRDGWTQCGVYWFQCDGLNWTLAEKFVAGTRRGVEYVSAKDPTYHATLREVLRGMFHREAAKAQAASETLDLLMVNLTARIERLMDEFAESPHAKASGDSGSDAAA